MCFAGSGGGVGWEKLGEESDPSLPDIKFQSAQ